MTDLQFYSRLNDLVEEAHKAGLDLGQPLSRICDFPCLSHERLACSKAEYLAQA